MKKETSVIRQTNTIGHLMLLEKHFIVICLFSINTMFFVNGTICELASDENRDFSSRDFNLKVNDVYMQ